MDAESSRVTPIHPASRSHESSNPNCVTDSLHLSDVAQSRKHGDEHGALHRRRRLLGSARGEGDVGGRRTRAHLRLGAELVAPRRALLADATMAEDVDGRF